MSMNLATREALAWWLSKKAKPALEELRVKHATLTRELQEVNGGIADLERRIREVEADFA